MCPLGNWCLSHNPEEWGRLPENRGSGTPGDLGFVTGTLLLSRRIISSSKCASTCQFISTNICRASPEHQEC